MSSILERKLGLALRVLRLRAGLDQAVLAGRIGVSQPTVSRWEKGLSEPDAAQLEQWLRAVRADPQLAELARRIYAHAEAPGGPLLGLLDGWLTAQVRTPGGEADTRIPYFADVAAGSGVWQEGRNGPRSYLQVPLWVLERDSSAYALRVQGASMAPQLIAGDIVVVSPQAALTPGCLVAAYIEPDGDVVKLYQPQPDGSALLTPVNSAYATVQLGGPGGRSGRIWGRVILQLRET